MSEIEPTPASSREDGLLRRFLPHRWQETSQSWAVWAVLIFMTIFFWWRGELGWSFLAIWSLFVTTAPVISYHSLGSVIPAGLILITAIPLIAYTFGLMMGVAHLSGSILDHAAFALGCYTIAFLTYICLARATTLRLNWALLNMAVVFLAVGICSFSLILSFLSDQYLSTNYLAEDNTIVMVELTWVLVGSLLAGWFVTKYIGPSPAIYQPFSRELPEGEK